MREDILGAPYTVEQIVLPDDDEGAVEATLVRRPADTKETRGAVFHVHGFAYYFFHTLPIFLLLSITSTLSTFSITFFPSSPPYPQLLLHLLHF